VSNEDSAVDDGHKQDNEESGRYGEPKDDT